jgi:hypothetical protein
MQPDRRYGSEIYKDVEIIWDEDHDERIKLFIDGLSPMERLDLAMCGEREGGIELYWKTDGPERFKSMDSVHIPGDDWPIDRQYHWVGNRNPLKIMAKLNNYECKSHVEINSDGNWNGYVVFPTQKNNFKVNAKAIYNGAALFDNHYFLVHGEVKVFNINSDTENLKIEFIGMKAMMKPTEALSEKPESFID